MGDYEIIKDEIYHFLDIDAYPQGQFSKIICIVTAGNKLTVININAQILGGE